MITDYRANDKQISLVQEVLATGHATRAAFLADPVGFAARHGVALDPGFESLINKALRNIELASAQMGHGNPYLDAPQATIPTCANPQRGVHALWQAKDPQEPVMALTGGLMAGAALASAVASAVSAGASVYNAVKFVPAPGGGGRV